MKNFILRYLGSYIFYAILGGIWLILIDKKYAGFYGKAGNFRWIIIIKKIFFLNHQIQIMRDDYENYK